MAGKAIDDDQNQPRSYWRWSRKDFFPEPSFQSWAAYLSALSQTPHRLKDRFLGRSSDTSEINDVRRRSENDMRRCLTWWDLTWFGFGSVIGAGIFVLTGQEAHRHAGPSIVLSYVASGVSAMLSVFCYTEFAVEIPVAGGSFAYLRVELGDFAAFIAAANLILESVIGSAAVARAWTSYFATLINRPPNSLRIRTNLANGFNLLDPIAVVVLMITATIAMISTRRTSQLNWAASAVHVVVIVFVIIAGFAHADAKNMSPFLPYGVPGIFRAAAIVYFAYGGFDTIATMAEETRNPSRDIPVGLLGSMTIITFIYCLMSLALSMMQRYTDIDPNAAYSVAFRRVGMNWAQYVVALGALKGMTTVLLVGAIGTSRSTTHIARCHIIPPFFALVHPRTATPIYATLLMTLSSASIALFSSLDVLTGLLSVSSLFIFTLMPAALLVRRYYARGISSRSDLLKLAICLLSIFAAAAATSAYWGLCPNGWIGYAITVPIWAAATAAIRAFLPPVRQPKVWGVPMVPWLPSLSIAMNLFLMGSLGAESFIRFGVCSAAMAIYYVFVGVHATYDVAMGYHDNTDEVRNDSMIRAVSDPT
ncbi:Cationic amino acid transporter 5 [Apostasia shenzhenica]|uniref:Cationic amino acid transporter 5 n=1 Tax=Apostasia shenzhenica TaxID=1088818 RepID=A0A2I0B9G0_9ASPA|nr:Cationic amino acid transporter 5 [Apostasia shenzhenica]